MGSTTVGTYVAESLPNIEGSASLDRLYGLVYQNSKLEGAFELGIGYGGISNGIEGAGYALNFNASNSSSTYQNGAKVRPDSLTCCYIIKY